MYLMTKYGIDAMNLVKSVEELIGKDLGIKEDDLDNQRFRRLFWKCNLRRIKMSCF